MWIHVDNSSVKIPPELVNLSQVLMDALSATDTSVRRKVSLPVPKEWLQAWAVCFCNEDERLGYQSIEDLINCVLVCLLLSSVAPIVPTSATSAVAVITACPAQA
jgi:hypothetical protein